MFQKGGMEENPTWRTSVHVCPTAVRNLIPAIHSSKLRRVSRAKSCRWDTRRSMIYFKRGLSHCEFMRITLSVIFSIVRSLREGVEPSPGLVVEAIADKRRE